MATYNGTSGSDNYSGGTDDDTINGNGGDDFLHGDDGNDTLDGGDGDDHVFGDAHDDVVRGGSGNDDVHGGDGNDQVYGDDGNDTVQGGEGDDYLDGGAGNDTYFGGAGADTFLVSEAGGADVIEDFKISENDVLLVDYPGVETLADLQALMSDDGNFGTLLTFPDCTTSQIRFIQPNQFTASNTQFAATPACVVHGTLVETDAGLVPVQKLRTLDNGFQSILAIVTRRYRFGTGPHRMEPIRFRRNCFGPGLPARELRLSPQHRVAISPTQPTALIAATKLTGLDGINGRPSCRAVRYYNVLTTAHELIRTEGLWTETLLVTPTSLVRNQIPAFMRQKTMTPARTILKNARALGAMLAAAPT